jgi:SNF2 family DNA or RNA helicase
MSPTYPLYPFKVKPFPHQLDCWTKSRDAVNYGLFMEMGTGKTKVLIDTLAYLYDNGKVNAALIIAPKGTYLNWVNNELPAHMPDHIKPRIASWSSGSSKNEQALNHLYACKDDLAIFLMNVEAMSHAHLVKVANQFLMRKNCLLCVDESTTIKSPTASRTKSLVKISQLAKYRRIMTGSPVTQSPLDMYTQFKFLDPYITGHSSYYAFRNHFAEVVQMPAGPRSYPKVVGYRNLDELQRMITKHGYRVTKKECLNLPEKMYTIRYVEMTPEQKRIYDDMKKKALVLLEGKLATAPIVLTQLLRLHQVACGHLKADDGTVVNIPNNRVDTLMEVLEEATGKVIIWANYREDIRLINTRLTEVYGPESVVRYTGMASNTERTEAIESFQNGKARFFLGTPAAGGFGITLTAANTVVYYSNSYSLETRIQSEDRAHRIGQNNSVLYVDLVCQNTVDEKILAAVKNKRNLASNLLDTWRDILL